MATRVDLRHGIEGRPDLRSVSLRAVTVGDLLAAGEFVATSSTYDAERRTETTRRTLDARRLAALLSRLTGLNADDLDGIDLRDLPAIVATLEAHVGIDPRRVLEVADQFVFDLERSFTEIEAMTIERLGRWFARAVAHHKKRNTANG